MDKFDYLTTAQIRELHDLGGPRNAQRILADMERESLITSFYLDEKIHYLSAAGRKMVDSTKIRKRTLQVPHFIIRNTVYIRFRPSNWISEAKIQWGDNTLIVDAFYVHNQQHYFLEVDRTQSMKQNENKIAQYKSLKESGLYQNKYGTFPTVIFVTTTEHRKKRLRACMEGLKSEVLLHKDLV